MNVDTTGSSDHLDHALWRYKSPQPSRVVIDPDGDLTLQVGQMWCMGDITATDYEGEESSEESGEETDHEHDIPVKYVVCSKTLSRASRVWKRMLYGGFAESKPLHALSASDWVVDLPDDNPKPWGIILNIIHGRFDAVPSANCPFDVEQLYQLSVITDKYDLTVILRPWARFWISPARHRYTSSQEIEAVNIAPDAERLLWIVRELGDIDVYQMAARHLIYHSYVDGDGNLLKSEVDTNGNLIQTGLETPMVPLFGSTLEPPGQLELLKFYRLQTIKNILGVYERAMDNLSRPIFNVKRRLRCKQTDSLQRDLGFCMTVIVARYLPDT
ncbi:hypothetical protein F4808DRAFT_461404 [Astrocystis sublimbata]|nr:hypothetical protein F4808DRAFT_461404 [Astrocystis sublimbata]